MTFQLDKLMQYFESAITKSICIAEKLMPNPQMTLREVTPAQLSQIILVCRGRRGLTAAWERIPVCLLLFPA